MVTTEEVLGFNPEELNPYAELEQQGYRVVEAPVGRYGELRPVAIKEDEEGKLEDVKGATLEELKEGLLYALDTATEAFLNGSHARSFMGITGENANTIKYELEDYAVKLAAIFNQNGVQITPSQIEDTFKLFAAGVLPLSEAMKPLIDAGLSDEELLEALKVVSEAYKLYLLYRAAQIEAWNLEQTFEQKAEEAFAAQAGISALYVPVSLVAQLENELVNLAKNAVEEGQKYTPEYLLELIKSELEATA